MKEEAGPTRGAARGSRRAAPASLRRLREFGVRPNRELGQNFLIDDNILRVIGSAAELDPDDVVLEVGGGLGVLSEFLAPQVAHLHVVEVDRSLEPALLDALGAFGNVTLHLADAVRMDLGAARAGSGQGRGQPALRRRGDGSVEVDRASCRGAQLWVAMVQREVAERLAAAPGGKSYGATSVLAQLSCEVRVLRKVPRTVFHPEPNVDSALVVLRRRAPAPPDELVALVHAGFAHRRKALAGSLALTPGAPEGIRDAARDALVELGHPADTRAERFAPGDWARAGRRRSATSASLRCGRDSRVPRVSPDVSPFS